MVKADIRIDLDARCSRCGAKGAAQNGLCLKCTGDDIVNKLKKEGNMAKVEAKVQTTKVEAKVKMVEEKVEGEIVDRHLITTATIEFEGTPAVLDKVLYALRSGQRIDVTFASPQLALDEKTQEETKETKEPKEAKAPALAAA